MNIEFDRMMREADRRVKEQEQEYRRQAEARRAEEWREYYRRRDEMRRNIDAGFFGGRR